ncbi:MAG TPA: AsmA-like C-terminal region-containing protein [Gemmataceae bacterium]|nr:AsmA-like C-terminal region-containing protein [Gemmataceae bacterium]
MVWRKWLVRSLVFTVGGGLALAAFAYQHWTNPAVVRRQVIAKLEELLPNAHVSLESARLRILGGISFDELHLARRDDPSRTDFISVPKGIIYPDKEQFLNGKLAIQRVVWYQPTIHLIRNKDGAWNTEHVLAPPTPEIAIPTIRLQNATFLIEDQQACPDARPLEIHDVNLVIMNDPHRPPTVSLLTFKGSGVADVAGTVHVEGGSLNRYSDEFSVSLQLPSFPVNGALVQRLAKFWPDAALHARELTGTAALQAEISYRPESESQATWHHDVRFHLTQGQFHHAQLPFPLHDLEARIRCVDGQITLEKFAARSGTAQFQLSGKALTMHADTDLLDGSLRVTHLPASKELFQTLHLEEIEHDYAPEGHFSLETSFSRRAGRWQEHCTIQLEGVKGVCAKFPYPLEQVTGTIEQTLDPSQRIDRLKVRLTGYAGSQPVLIQGEIEGEKPASVTLRISATHLLIDDKLCAALQPELYHKLVRPFRPSGYVDVVADIRRAQGGTQFTNDYVLTFHDAAIAYEAFPYPIENVSGTVTIGPDHWEYYGFRGNHNGGEFRSRGKPIKTPQGNRIQLEITGTNLLLDRELRAALKCPALETAWRKLNPGGRMDFSAQVDLIDGQDDPVIAVTAIPREATIKPEFFPCALSNLHGTIRYQQHHVELQNLSARHEQTRLSVEHGEIISYPDGSFSVKLTELLGHPIVPDAEFVRALPPALGHACRNLRLKEPLSLRTNLTIAVPAADQAPSQVQWDGGVRLKDATLVAGVPWERVNGLIWCSGEHRGGAIGKVEGNLILDEATVFQQTLHEIHSKLFVDAKEPDILILPDLHAKIYNGDVGGSVRVDFGPTLRYEAELTALQLQLEKLSLSNRLGPNAQQSGLLDARLSLQGQGTGLGGLKGTGSIDVPNGKMGNLPLLLDLLKFLSLRFPDGTFFEEAHARFTLDGPRVDINRVDLLGAAISLGGSGTVNLDSGAYNMELFAVWGRIVQLSPSLLKDFWPTLSELFLKIKMKGKIGEPPRFEKELVPGLTEPLERMRDRLGGRASG